MAFNFAKFKDHLITTEEWLRKEYSHISTGRANPALLDSITVESYGSHQPIRNIASISIEESRTLRIVPWDKSQIGAIQKAIQTSGLPFSVSADSDGVRAMIPQLTEENKRGIVKLLKEKLEDARITVRGHRQDVDKEIDFDETAGNLSEDDKKRAKDEMQKLVDIANKNLEEIFMTKEKDIMSI
ncbi:ribosome recycling factor [Candidatus Nomurabacteria bacterium RIFCSPLOWO2_01_FULL_36_10b]|uniref:Ribosome-recycling factor n=1 Tax=Candidatus Nomurabacteria bacterium RIFCSPLOWO2_01_FULL_36_10b TaxID=1801766 RepID=A0A1F6WQ00_9BACT|nr:MAG: ribosome recycling factor [Candidatus Nomurabacteria bacterium RIFCSPLOWO2_01_FULL_36_10b]